MPEYTYHPDLRPYARMKFPLSPRLVRLSQGPMALLYAMQRSDKSLRVSRGSVPRPDGSRMRMLLYSPVGETGTMPCLYFLHGGGFAFNAAPREWLSPAESASVQGLPRAYIETAEYDCLRDEGAAYAARLMREGVVCEYHAIKNAMHGYDIACRSDFLKAVMAYRIEFMRGVFTGK